MQGISVTSCIMDHAITIQEFKTIYSIFNNKAMMDGVDVK